MAETTIQALNPRTSPNQRDYRVQVWAGSESQPGVGISWVVRGSGIAAVIGRAARAFRASHIRGRRFTDWTINVEPLRGGETIIEPEPKAKKGTPA